MEVNGGAPVQTDKVLNHWFVNAISRPLLLMQWMNVAVDMMNAALTHVKVIQQKENVIAINKLSLV